MNRLSRGHRMVTLVAAAVVAACGTGSVSPGAPTSAVPSAAPPTITAVPSAVSPAPTASPSPSRDVLAVLLEGTWATEPIPIANVLATVRESHVSDEHFAAYFRDAGATTVTYKLRFLGDRMAWIETLDDGPDEVGAAGPYWIENGTTIVFPDTSGSGQVRVEFSVSGDTLTTHADPDAQTTADRQDPVALSAVAAWFNSRPYMRQPG